MESVCRLCLKESFDHENIFSLKHGWVIAELIAVICPSLNISRNDLLTKNICSECLQIIWQACELRQRSIESEEYLNSQSELLKVEFVKQEICETLEENHHNVNPQFTIKEECFVNVPTETQQSKNQTKCPYCSKILGKRSLTRHIKKIHDSNEIVKTEERKTSRTRRTVTERLKEIQKQHDDKAEKMQTNIRQPIGCSFCPNCFSSSTEMKKHLKRCHGVEDPNLLFYFCAHCHFSSNHKLLLEIHIKKHFGIDSKPFVCSTCGNGFLDQRNLRRHLYRVHKVSTKNTFFCGECNFYTLQKVKLELHMMRVHLKTVDDFICDLCEIVCKTKHEKSLHHYAHSDIVELCNQDLQMLGCPICPEKFQFKDELLQHLPVHENETEKGTTACILCSKVLEKGYNQTFEHTKSQHVQKFTHRCTECNRKYFYGMKFLVHIKNHKEKRNLDHLCTECGAAFPHAADLNKHVRIEHKKIYRCPHCVDVVYKSIPAFRQHVDGHTNNRKYKCPLCPKTFSVRNKFNSHYAFHLNDKMNQCPTCGKGFENAFSLKVHMQRHDGTLVKPHECGFCGKKFRTKWARDQHERIHTNEKPFQCEHCPSSYKQKGDYMKHLKVHLGDAIYQCPDCPEGFRLLKELNNHKMNKHHI